MKKRIFFAGMVVTAMMVLFSSIAFAAPAKLSEDEKSTASLVELSKPEDDFSTFSDSCIVSGKSKQGVKISVYIRKDKEDTYEKKLMADEEEVSWTVGVSGVFAKEIGLERDKVNNIIIYAEKDEKFQIIKRQITVKKLTLKQILKNEVVKIEDLISKVMK